MAAKPALLINPPCTRLMSSRGNLVILGLWVYRKVNYIKNSTASFQLHESTI